MPLRVSEVFVPGGLPKHTYVSRAPRNLEAQLAAAKDNLCKIATVTGATKCGKTVLVRKVFAPTTVWLDGGTLEEMSDFWEGVAHQLGAIQEQEVAETRETGAEIAGELALETNVFIAKGTGKVAPKLGTRRGKTTKRRLAISPPIQCTRMMQASKIPLVIDDFHYVDRQLQGQITRVLKPLVFDGVPVVYLAIPHRRFDAVKVEREMNGRVHNVPVPMWETDELMQIAQLGFPLLNIKPHPDTSRRLAVEAQGSPHLMQEFCKKICFLSNLEEASDPPRAINPNFAYERIYRDVAKDLGKNIYDKLAQGSRQRSDRLQRKLVNGKTSDIYRVVLIALADLKPGVETVDYERLRGAIRNVLDDALPQAHEVSRVLEQMAKISSTDESSVPVIDYEKDDRRLHITDPFFAFFLRWGRAIIDA